MDVILSMPDGGNSIGATTTIYEECTFLFRGVSHVSFAHCSRKDNIVAYWLVRWRGPVDLAGGSTGFYF
jgi:hypothetical protein